MAPRVREGQQATAAEPHRDKDGPQRSDKAHERVGGHVQRPELREEANAIRRPARRRRRGAGSGGGKQGRHARGAPGRVMRGRKHRTCDCGRQGGGHARRGRTSGRNRFLQARGAASRHPSLHRRLLARQVLRAVWEAGRRHQDETLHVADVLQRVGRAEVAAEGVAKQHELLQPDGAAPRFDGLFLWVRCSQGRDRHGGRRSGARSETERGRRFWPSQRRACPRNPRGNGQGTARELAAESAPSSPLGGCGAQARAGTRSAGLGEDALRLLG